MVYPPKNSSIVRINSFKSQVNFIDIANITDHSFPSRDYNLNSIQHSLKNKHNCVHWSFHITWLQIAYLEQDRLETS